MAPRVVVCIAADASVAVLGDHLVVARSGARSAATSVAIFDLAALSHLLVDAPAGKI